MLKLLLIISFFIAVLLFTAITEPTIQPQVAQENNAFESTNQVTELDNEQVQNQKEVADTKQKAQKIEAQTSQGVDGSMAYIIAQDYLEIVALNSSPSSTLTTAFPMPPYEVKNMGNGRWNVVSFVDIRNAFGTESRHNWGVTLRYRGGLWANYTNWELERLIFDDKLVYP